MFTCLIHPHATNPLLQSFSAISQPRAFFVESDTRLNIYAYWGDRVAEDLRHEVTHGYLHAMVPHSALDRRRAGRVF